MNKPGENLKDYYYILGVPPEATQAQIEAAYQDLYDKFGPHVTVKQQDPESMIKAYKDICEAWEVLGDPAKRQEYDKSHLPFLEKTSLRNIWSKFAGIKTEGVKAKDEPEDTHVVLEITLRESIKGGRKGVRVEDSLPCPTCAGKKPVERTKCFDCHGSGLKRIERTEDIELTPGLYDKQELRLPGKGRFDQRARKNGDLILEVQLAPHPFFSVHGKDVSCTVPITLYEAILGGEIESPTPTGRVAIKIQPLTQPKRVYRLKGLGLGLGIERGDLLIATEVLIPTQLHADEVELFRRLAVVSSQPNPRTDIFAKISAMTQSPNTAGSSKT